MNPMFPLKNVVGYALSLILTFAALGLGVAHVLPFGAVMVVLMILAVMQIAVQLYFFMHFMESDGPAYHVIGLALGVIFTIAVVAGSVWVMTFNAQVH
ncbi:MAG TPA: cytochrome C oxidase subunit IV family protein [Bacillales bacterium]|nr:cytochrome C oxidase subunit IV family protein [Bacillales bacterium]